MKWLNEEIPKDPQDYVKELEAENKQLKRERDQAVKDLYYIAKEISECDIKLSGDDEDCVSSLNLGRCSVCKSRYCEDRECKFEWRGVQEENDG